MDKSEKDVPVATQPVATGYPPGQSSLRQRTSIRKPASCTVQVRLGANFLLIENAQDLSLTGIFVDMDTRNVLPGDSIEVRIGAVSRFQQPLELVLPADVVRVEDGGAALRFRAYPSKTYTELVNLLYAW